MDLRNKAFFNQLSAFLAHSFCDFFIFNNKIVVKEALSDPEFIEVDGIGTLEAFNTDGLRTLLQTMKIPNMIEKTLRYPGHRELMNILKYSGFFNEEEIKIKDQTVRPIDITSKLLFRLWKPEKEDDEFTVMKLFISGNENDEKKEYVYEIFDKFDGKTKTTSKTTSMGLKRFGHQ